MTTSRVKICPEGKSLENNSDVDSGLRSVSGQHSLVVRAAIVTERRWFEPHFLPDCVLEQELIAANYSLLLTMGRLAPSMATSTNSMSE